jgi:hypothetical protein
MEILTTPSPTFIFFRQLAYYQVVYTVEMAFPSRKVPKKSSVSAGAKFTTTHPDRRLSTIGGDIGQPNEKPATRHLPVAAASPVPDDGDGQSTDSDPDDDEDEVFVAIDDSGAINASAEGGLAPKPTARRARRRLQDLSVGGRIRYLIARTMKSVSSAPWEKSTLADEITRMRRLDYQVLVADGYACGFAISVAVTNYLIARFGIQGPGYCKLGAAKLGSVSVSPCSFSTVEAVSGAALRVIIVYITRLIVFVLGEYIVSVYMRNRMKAAHAAANSIFSRAKVVGDGSTDGGRIGTAQPKGGRGRVAPAESMAKFEQQNDGLAESMLPIGLPEDDRHRQSIAKRQLKLWEFARELQQYRAARTWHETVSPHHLHYLAVALRLGIIILENNIL